MDQPIQTAAGTRPASTYPETSPQLGALTLGAEQAVKAMVEYQSESLRFVAKRTEAYLEFLRRLCQCKGWEEAASVQQAFAKDFVADCGEEMGRLAGASLQLGTRGVGPMQWLLYRQMPKARGGNGSRPG